MACYRGLCRVLRISQQVGPNITGHLEKNILQHRRLLHHESIRNPERAGKFIYRTALTAGGLLVGGLVIKLNSRTLDNHANDDEEKQDDDQCRRQTSSLSLSEAIKQSRDMLQIKKVVTGSPGLTVAVSVDGKTVWAEGMGYSDIENNVKCTPDTVFRIASISKSITMATVAKLIECGDLDLDKPLQYYVPEFPEKIWEGQKVVVTTRQLLSHVGGIRHYWKDYMTKKAESSSKKAVHVSVTDTKIQNEEQKKDKREDTKDEMCLDEYYISKHYQSVQESLALFKDDPLVHKPGTKFLYTTHGWTLISAVIEKAAKMPFEELMRQALDELGLENTYLEEHQPLIKNRGRHYVKNKKGHVENAPYVDLSYKWAGGGLISNVLDIVQFGNAMLYSFQARPDSSSRQRTSSSKTHQIQKSSKTEMKELEDQGEGTGKISGYLKPESMKMMWTPVIFPGSKFEAKASDEYGMGWRLCSRKHEYAFGKNQRFYACHTGGTIGASSVLLILPTRNSQMLKENITVTETDGSVRNPPRGVVVAIIVNMTSVGLRNTAFDIAKLFEKIDLKI